MNDQQMFDRNIGFLWKAAKWLFKALIYFPLIITSFIIVSSIMKKEVSSLLGLAVIILVSFILYLLVYFVKGILICLKSNNKLLWILPFIICVSFTCILPVYIVLDPVGRLVQSSSRSGTSYDILKWIFSLAFGVYVYFRYDFLTNIAPSVAFPAYQAGISITMSILKRSYRIEAKKSNDLI
ncbi:hypothetical protein DLD77_10485 [Chitinophaga alhagiae]|uniref:DUF805 domain-containing protein n=1 Tax=Chitinophaga alhagiae TaxID=2203219 RepID=A0ABN5LRP8_9BACT|nr:hypothetical protein [Chitinophaga alhagiae]AWO02091.1 hypothetical protein DLD77_10485 [Chitinophaga alhagiae]